MVNAKIEKLPGFETELNKKHPISDIKPAPSPNPKQGFQWKNVKKHFCNEADAEIMKSFLHLRLKDTLDLIQRILKGSEAHFPSDKNSVVTFNGDLGETSTSDVHVKIDISKKDVFGHYIFRNTGSGTLKSDIDYQVNFVSQGATIYERLDAIRILIQVFNNNFQTEHGKSSLYTYDINMYSADFGNADVLAEVGKIKVEDKEKAYWNNFVSANRYSQLHILYYDALEILHEMDSSVTVNGIRTKEVISKIAEILTQSDNGKTCGSFLFDMENQKLEKTKARYSHSDEDRNKAMVMHVKLAAASANDKTTAFCHVLAANFMALEAYVSYGSVSRMMIAQNGLTETQIPDSIKPDEDVWTDYLLMNFGYAIEHYSEAMKEKDKDDAFEKLGKYTQRLYRAVDQLTNLDHKKCWQTIFLDLGIGFEAEDKKMRTKIIAELKKPLVKVKIPSYFNAGYVCVGDYVLKLRVGSASPTAAVPAPAVVVPKKK